MEAAAYAGRLYDHLSRHFGPGVSVQGYRRHQQRGRSKQGACHDLGFAAILYSFTRLSTVRKLNSMISIATARRG